MKCYAHVLGFLFSAMTACGYALEYQLEVDFHSIKLLLAVICYTHVFAVLLCILWTCTDSWKLQKQRPENHSAVSVLTESILNKPILVMLILLVLWMPCYISVFPGGFTYDATAEFNQMVTGFHGDFPLLHSLLITSFLSLGHALTGSYNTGIAIFAIAQMLFAAALFARILCTMRHFEVNITVLAVLLMYYAVFPVIPMLITCTVRDVLFGLLLTYLVFLLYCFGLQLREFTASKAKLAELALVLVLTLLSRNNNAGLVVLIVLMVVCAIITVLMIRVGSRLVVFFNAATLVNYVLLTCVLSALCQPFTPARTNSALSLFSQSIVRAYLADSEQWTDGEVATFEKYVSTENLWYVPENADSTKWNLQIAEGKTEDFLRFWIKIGAKYPGVYANAVLANTRQMWFPDAVVDGYQEASVGSYSEYDKCYFSNTDEIAAPGIHKQYFPSTRNFYKSIGLMISFEKIPILSAFFSIGAHFWLMLYTVFYIEYKKCSCFRLPCYTVLIYALLSAFVPLVLLRYFCGLFFAFPLVCAFVWQCPENAGNRGYK